jgi:hypothetical protein
LNTATIRLIIPKSLKNAFCAKSRDAEIVKLAAMPDERMNSSFLYVRFFADNFFIHNPVHEKKISSILTLQILHERKCPSSCKIQADKPRIAISLSLRRIKIANTAKKVKLKVKIVDFV